MKNASETLILLVDLSASGAFGLIDQGKREQAAEVASVLAFSAIRNSDKVGLLLFTDQVETFIAPRKGRQYVMRLIRDIIFWEPKGCGTDIVGALDYLNTDKIAITIPKFTLLKHADSVFQRYNEPYITSFAIDASGSADPKIDFNFMPFPKVTEGAPLQCWERAI